ncbi:Wall-associated receptor kinase-like [Thalictrum thalictroides]|uniref:Wall-associated receptor kinase-like n=1 Tax=Thalictrum thalictroides TaxID=46969 RepID=A0A7J6X5F4_THATH|nr:Wall-associated receptor kinase-like [Thalictrum thalictroides]
MITSSSSHRPFVFRRVSCYRYSPYPALSSPPQRPRVPYHQQPNSFLQQQQQQPSFSLYQQQHSSPLYQQQQQQPPCFSYNFTSERPLFFHRPSFPSPTLPLSYEFAGPFDHVNPSLPVCALYYKWSKPLGHFCTLNTDGSVAKRRSGIGGIVRNSDGVPLIAFAARCPKMPIYAVELWAVRRGLQLALSKGVQFMNIDIDSTDAVKWIFSLPSSCPILEGGVDSTKIFTSEELKLATNNYDQHHILGRGGYATVCKSVLTELRVVAIKKSKLIDESQLGWFPYLFTSLCLMGPCPIIYTKAGRDAWISISWEDFLRIAAETAGAIVYLHSAASTPIIHRDIKSTNILLDQNNTAKVADFGASRLNT